MTEPQLAEFIDWSIDALERQLAEAKRQRDELHDFKAGRRKSKHKLGSVYYMRWGLWMDDLRTTTERWADRYAE